MRSRVLLVSTLASVLLLVAETFALGEAPTDRFSGEEIVTWFAGHGVNARLYAWLLIAFVPAFAAFAALVRRRLPAPHRDMFFVGTIAILAETAVSTWFWAGLAWHPDQLSPPVARVLLDVASFWGPVINGATITMLAPVVALSWGQDALLPRWLGVLGTVTLGEQVVESVATIFGTSGFAAPGGPMNLMLGAGLVTGWVLCLGLVLARRPDLGGPTTPSDQASAVPAAG